MEFYETGGGSSARLYWCFTNFLKVSVRAIPYFRDVIISVLRPLQVTNLATRQVRQYGMGDEGDGVGLLSFPVDVEEERQRDFLTKPYSKRLQYTIDMVSVNINSARVSWAYHRVRIIC